MTEHSIGYWNKQNEKLKRDRTNSVMTDNVNRQFSPSKYRYNNETEKWLNQHGGRNYSDLLSDNSGKYVIMDNRRVYLPILLKSDNINI